MWKQVICGAVRSLALGDQGTTMPRRRKLMLAKQGRKLAKSPVGPSLRLAAFTLAGAMAGLSGSLLIMHNGFISPSSIHWSQSSILLVMLVLGGVARPWGAAIGTTVWMVLEEVLRQSTEYWHWPLGALLILIVLAAPQGLTQLHRRVKLAPPH